MKAAGHGKTDPGLKRKNNDDFFLVDDELHLYVVCDGVGGHASGNVASQLCATTIRDFVRKRRDIIDGYTAGSLDHTRAHVIDLMRKAVEAANLKVYETGEQDPKHKGMSTTVDALLLLHDYAILAHIGDSRIYLVRSGKTHLLTEDHKVSADMVRQGVWTEEQAAKSGYSHVLSRAVGMQSLVPVDLLQLELVDSDFFLLCSDGLADYLGKQGLTDWLKKTPAEKMPETMVEFAIKQGGKDNITVVTVQVETSGIAAGSLALDALRKSEILGKVPLFRYLNFPELMKVLSIVELEEHDIGMDLLKEGSPGEYMFILVSGSVDVIKAGQVIAHRGKGDFFGEMSLFDRAPRSASVRTSEPTSIITLGRKELMTLLRQESQIAVKFLWALNQEISQRLRITSQDLALAKATLETQLRTELPFDTPETTK